MYTRVTTGMVQLGKIGESSGIVNYKKLTQSLMITGFLLLTLVACVTPTSAFVSPNITPTSIPLTATLDDKHPASELVLETVDQKVLGGYYKRNGRAIRFKIEIGPPWVMKLETMSGEPLIQLRFAPDGTLSKTAVLGNKAVLDLTHTQDGSSVATITGDSSILQRFQFSSAEIELLPALSRELGKEGITGQTYPVSFPLHLMAMGVARRHPNGDEFEPAEPTTASCVDVRHDPCAPRDCFGMCGKGCDCWEWVCGDCCCNIGCRRHDGLCSKCDTDPVACWLGCYSVGAVPVVFYCDTCTYDCSTPTPRPDPNCGFDTCGRGEKCCGDFCVPDNRICP